MNECKILTRSLAARHISELVAIDQSAVGELGGAYSDEEWSAESFLRELPGKWTYSVAVLRRGKIRGFWIASLKSSDVVYAHRIAVEPAARHEGLGRKMFEAVLGTVKAQRIPRMALSVSMLNANAVRFFERMGFRRVYGARLADLLGGTANNATFEFDHYRLLSGQRNFVYERLVEEGQIEDFGDRGSS